MQTQETRTEIDETPVFLYQLVRRTDNGFGDEYVVTDIDGGTIRVQDPEFEFPAIEIDADEWANKEFEAATAATGVPVWAY